MFQKCREITFARLRFLSAYALLVPCLPIKPPQESAFPAYKYQFRIQNPSTGRHPLVGPQPIAGQHSAGDRLSAQNSRDAETASRRGSGLYLCIRIVALLPSAHSLQIYHCRFRVLRTFFILSFTCLALASIWKTCTFSNALVNVGLGSSNPVFVLLN